MDTETQNLLAELTGNADAKPNDDLKLVIIGNKVSNNAWDKAAKHYHENVFYIEGQPVKNEADDYWLSKFKDIYKPGMTVLEIGSGDGRVLDLIKREGYKDDGNEIRPADYTGYDPSVEMVTIAAETFQDFKFINNLDDLELKHFDIVLCINVLNYSNNMEEIKELVDYAASMGDTVILSFLFKDEKPHSSAGSAVPEFKTTFPNPDLITNYLFPGYKILLKAFRSEIARTKEHKTVVIITDKIAVKEKAAQVDQVESQTLTAITGSPKETSPVITAAPPVTLNNRGWFNSGSTEKTPDPADTDDEETDHDEE